MRSYQIILIVIVCFLPGCVDQSSTQISKESTSVDGQSAGTLAPRKLVIGDAVAGLEIAALLQANGKESASLDELKGNTIVLQFWATW